MTNDVQRRSEHNTASHCCCKPIQDDKGTTMIFAADKRLFVQFSRQNIYRQMSGLLYIVGFTRVLDVWKKRTNKKCSLYLLIIQQFLWSWLDEYWQCRSQKELHEDQTAPSEMIRHWHHWSRNLGQPNPVFWSCLREPEVSTQRVFTANTDTHGLTSSAETNIK